MPALMISRCDRPGSAVLTVVGEIDICTAPELRASLQQVPLTDLVLDLSAVGFLAHPCPPAVRSAPDPLARRSGGRRRMTDRAAIAPLQTLNLLVH